LLSHRDPALAIGLLMCSMLLVIASEATKEFHDAANAVLGVLIGVSGFTGLAVSTIIVTSGIGGTMVISGAGLRIDTLSRILVARPGTLPLTILVATSVLSA
jgi:hypothetical protein